MGRPAPPPGGPLVLHPPPPVPPTRLTPGRGRVRGRLRARQDAAPPRGAPAARPGPCARRLCRRVPGPERHDGERRRPSGATRPGSGGATGVAVFGEQAGLRQAGIRADGLRQRVQAAAGQGQSASAWRPPGTDGPTGAGARLGAGNGLGSPDGPSDGPSDGPCPVAGCGHG
ncbi:hypothetical protein BKD26_07510 [Streptomyces sp. CB03238]|nr:hypothetical protein BKD26_07510 [Streptomyces sp. CB03238]